MCRGGGEESHGIYSRSRNFNLPQVTAAGSTKPTVLRAPRASTDKYRVGVPPRRDTSSR
jgi:hypothetical protein